MLFDEFTLSTFLNLVGSFSGLIGSLLVAFAVGRPKGMNTHTNGTAVDGKLVHFAYIKSYPKFNIGVLFVIFAFIFQIVVVFLGPSGIQYENYDQKKIDCLKLGSDDRAKACIALVNKMEQESINPLIPSKDVYQVGEDIGYSYLTLRIESVKRLSSNQVEIDLYAYNSKDNPNKLLIFNSQFLLEASDNIRIEPNYDGGRLRGVEVRPGEAVRGRVIFQNDALKESKDFSLKAQPFDGSPALSIDISKYL